jgi:hypothetical protein
VSRVYTDGPMSRLFSDTQRQPPAKVSAIIAAAMLLAPTDAREAVLSCVDLDARVLVCHWLAANDRRLK